MKTGTEREEGGTATKKNDLLELPSNFDIVEADTTQTRKRKCTNDERGSINAEVGEREASRKRVGQQT